MYKAFTIFAALWVLAATVCGEFADVLDQGIGLFRTGYLQWNADPMKAGLQLMEQVPPDSVSLYWQAVARFHLILCGDESELSETVRFMEEGARRNPQDAEGSMMLAVLYGRQIAEKPVRAMWLGRKIRKLRKAALAREPDNPRVQSLIGACWFEAPVPFGNRELALEHLTKAAELYEAEQAADLDFRQPHWGATDCYQRIGKLMAERGDTARAEFYYQSALRVNPLYKPSQRGLKEIEDEQ